MSTKSTDAIPGRLPEALPRAPLDDAVGYLHLDVDVLDPSVGRANYLQVPGGLSVEQLTGAIAALRRRVPRRLHRAGAMLTEISR